MKTYIRTVLWNYYWEVLHRTFLIIRGKQITSSSFLFWLQKDSDKFNIAMITTLVTYVYIHYSFLTDISSAPGSWTNCGSITRTPAWSCRGQWDLVHRRKPGRAERSQGQQAEVRPENWTPGRQTDPDSGHYHTVGARLKQYTGKSALRKGKGTREDEVENGGRSIGSCCNNPALRDTA